nr:SMP-30/gluconolactonase/LRE family protein [Pseudenhygromyxa sp. WMMC2535]
MSSSLVLACGEQPGGDADEGEGETQTESVGSEESSGSSEAGSSTEDTSAGDSESSESDESESAQSSESDESESEASTGEDPPALCPEGLDGQVPSLDGLAFELVASPPEDGYAEGFEILEGPVWIDGALHVSHIAGGGPPPKARILRLEGDALVEVLATAGSNGLAVDDQGQLVAARHEDGSVSTYAIDELDAAPQVWISEYEGARFNSPNDLVISSAGVLYFTDPDWQAPSPAPQAAERAYYVLPGADAAVAFAEEVAKPNGVVLSLDEAKIYVGGTEGLFAYALAADGSVGAGGQVDSVAGGGFDGTAKDCAGNLYFAANGQVMVVTPDEQVYGSLSLANVTNLAFGGPDGTTLYATTLNQAGVYAVELGVPGFPY